MNSKIENRLSMYRTVESVCDKVGTQIQTVPALWTNYQLFKTTIVELDDMVQLQIKKIKGITADKNTSREKLIELMQNISVVVKAYAAEIGNSELYNAVHYSPSSLRRMRDETLYEAANIVRTLADANVAELPPYGFIPSVLVDLGAAIDDYKDKIEDPDEARKMRKVYTRAINDIDKRLRKLLYERIDNGISALGVTNPLIAKRYKSARVIYDYSSGKKKAVVENELIAMLSGTITDTEGLPVSDVTVRIDTTTINTLTDADGEYLLEVPAGTYNLIVSMEGYNETRENNLKIASGDDLVKDFTIEASATE